MLLLNGTNEHSRNQEKSNIVSASNTKISLVVCRMFYMRFSSSFSTKAAAYIVVNIP